MMNPYRRFIEAAKEHGYVFYRQGKGDHEVWIHSKTNKRITIPTGKTLHYRAQLNILANIKKKAQNAS